MPLPFRPLDRSTDARLLALVALALAVAPLPAQEPGRIGYEEYELPNGLRVILAENHSTQVVAVDLWYDVGSRNEVPGRTGFAHLFEHMMFEGSAHVKKAEHLQLISRAGGSMNGQTEEDITRYFETLPSNRLNLGLWLEADRMWSLAVTDSNFRNQREVVKEERRLSYDNQPYAGAFIEGLAAGYDSVTCFGYAHPTIGSMDDLNAASLEDVQAFFRLYYTPSNARLVVSGDFDRVQAKRLIADYFGDIPRGATPPPVACVGGYHPGARRRTVNDRLANLPAAVNFYRIPDHAHDDTPALELLSTILGQGESSRLNTRLARDARAAVSTQAAIFANRRGPSLFGAFAVANQGVTADSLAALLAAEVARISEEGVSEAELNKAKNVYRATVISNRQRPFDVAEELHHAATFHGSAEAVNGDFARYMAVTLEDIRRVAQTYLKPDNVLVLIVNAGAAP